MSVFVSIGSIAVVVNTRIATMPRFTLDGVTFHVGEVYAPRMAMPSETINRFPGERSYGGYRSFVSPDCYYEMTTYVEVKKTLSPATLREDFYQLFDGINLQNIIGLGDGFICEHCGTYTPRGGKQCLKCNAAMTIIPYVNPVRMPLGVASYGRDEMMDMWYVMFRVAEGEHHGLKSLVQKKEQKIVSLPHGVELDGRWVCQYCGRIIEPDQECSTCGGRRLPYAELLKVDAQCLYCGKRTTDGPVCKSCQHTLLTLTLGETLRAKNALDNLMV